MRRIVLLLIAAVYLIFGFLIGKAQATAKQECRFQHVDHATWTQTEENKTAKCVVDRFGPIPGGLPKLRSVGSCESGWYRLARNGDYVGLFQHDIDSWPSRLHTFEPNRWKLRDRWQNSRSAITVTVRMVKAGGWGPWSCAG